MNFAVTGSSGLIGSAVIERLRAADHRIVRVVRKPVDQPPEEGTIHWQPEAGRIDTDRLARVDAFVHLAGENIAGRWTASKKRRIEDSRVLGTRTLCRAIAAMKPPPHTLLVASAIGFYGDRGDETLTDDSPPGEGFLPEVCRRWEAETRVAAEAGVRVVNLRLGVVLSGKGGALTKMLTPFRFGLGGRVGNGRQWMSWISLDDAARAFEFAATEESLYGPANLTAPNPVTNRDFTRALAHALHRPAVLPAPAFALKLVLGQMADELLLASTRAVPDRLIDAGFEFAHRELGEALRIALD